METLSDLLNALLHYLDVGWQSWTQSYDGKDKAIWDRVQIKLAELKKHPCPRCSGTGVDHAK